MTIVKPQQISSWSHRLIDVRNADEYASERLASPSECIPLSSLPAVAAGWDRGRPLLLLCKGGVRARQAAEQLENMGFTQVNLVEGGLEGCKKAGVSVVAGGGPIPMFRQVFIAAGVLLLVGLGLALIHPAFLALNILVAAGLTMAGITGFCPMARLLGRMSWNKTKSCTAGSCTR